VRGVEFFVSVPASRSRGSAPGGSESRAGEPGEVRVGDLFRSRPVGGPSADSQPVGGQSAATQPAASQAVASQSLGGQSVARQSLDNEPGGHAPRGRSPGRQVGTGPAEGGLLSGFRHGDEGVTLSVPRHRANVEPQSAGLARRRPMRRTVAAVRDSWWHLGDVDLLADRVEANLIALAPGSRIALLERRAAGEERLVTALLRCVDALAEAPEPAVADRQVRVLGQALTRSGMPFVDVPQVGFALVRAVRDRYTGQWTTTLGSAWTAVQTWLVEQLLLGARDIEPPPLVDLSVITRP
jgi:hypothetical protein